MNEYIFRERSLITHEISVLAESVVEARELFDGGAGEYSEVDSEIESVAELTEIDGVEQ